MLAPEQIIPDSQTEALADLRLLADRYPESLFAEMPPADMERIAALQWLHEDGLEVRA